VLCGRCHRRHQKTGECGSGDVPFGDETAHTFLAILPVFCFWVLFAERMFQRGSVGSQPTGSFIVIVTNLKVNIIGNIPIWIGCHDGECWWEEDCSGFCNRGALHMCGGDAGTGRQRRERFPHGECD
jgi:hypothetical protein